MVLEIRSSTMSTNPVQLDNGWMKVKDLLHHFDLLCPGPRTSTLYPLLGCANNLGKLD